MGGTPWGKTNSLKDLSKGNFLLECGENINLPDFNFLPFFDKISRNVSKILFVPESSVFRVLGSVCAGPLGKWRILEVHRDPSLCACGARASPGATARRAWP